MLSIHISAFFIFLISNESRGRCVRMFLCCFRSVDLRGQARVFLLAKTVLGDGTGGEIVYTPPEGEDVIRDKLKNLEFFLNDDNMSELDPIVKMAISHYQFEAIHPFGDGNGRTGRIINVLYLISKGLLDLPILYLKKMLL